MPGKLFFQKKQPFLAAMYPGYPDFVRVVTVADASDEDHVGNSLLQIWKLRFGLKA